MGYFTELNQEEKDAFKLPLIERSQINVFISYSHKDKKIAGEIKEILEKFDLSCFLAHEDIEPSSSWIENMNQNLKECEIFIPILTTYFNESIFANQEVGGAFFMNKYIFPIKINQDPEAFISHIQAYSFKIEQDRNRKNELDLVLSLCKGTINWRKISLNAIVRSFLINMFVKSWSFYESESISRVLSKYQNFSEGQLNEIFRGFLINNQVSNANETREFIKRLYKKHENEILPNIKLKVKKLLAEFEKEA
jgi:hypothetical protein